MNKSNDDKKKLCENFIDNKQVTGEKKREMNGKKGGTKSHVRARFIVRCMYICICISTHTSMCICASGWNVCLLACKQAMQLDYQIYINCFIKLYYRKFSPLKKKRNEME